MAYTPGPVFGADGLLWKKRQVLGHVIDFTAADIIQQCVFFSAVEHQGW